MKTLRGLLTESEKRFEGLGFQRRVVFFEMLTIARRFSVALEARTAYDAGMRQDEGPVYFGRMAWKTDFWKRQWEWQKAYREGEAVRASFGGKDENPYQKESFPFSLKGIELEMMWNHGFDGEDL